MEKLNIFGNKKVADCLCVSLQFRNFAQTKLQLLIYNKTDYFYEELTDVH